MNITKRYLTYEELRVRAQLIANYIRKNVEKPSLVAVTRGGLAIAQLVAYKLALPVSVFYPKDLTGAQDYPILTGPALIDGDETLIFLEDVVAEGRTYRIVNDFIDMPKQKWLFIPVVFDSKLNPADFPNIPEELIWACSDWVVFPHEDIEQVVAGDRGLFRDRTSENSKAIV